MKHMHITYGEPGGEAAEKAETQEEGGLSETLEARRTEQVIATLECKH